MNKDKLLKTFEIIIFNDELMREKIQNQFRYQHFYRQVSLEEKVYHILLNENQEELIKEKFLKYLICSILKNSSVSPEMMYNTLKRNLNNGLISYRDINYLTNNYDGVTKDYNSCYRKYFCYGL